MCRIVLIGILIGFFPAEALTQHLVWVQFNVPKAKGYDPYLELHSDAINRRLLECIDLHDSTDAPLDPCLRHSVIHLSDSVVLESRWLNGMAVWVAPVYLDALRTLPGVASVCPLPLKRLITHTPAAEAIKDSGELTRSRVDNLLEYQYKRLQGPLLEQAGLTGKGVRIAVFDVGFQGADRTPALGHLFTRNQIEATHDFVRKQPISWKTVGTHGTQVLSCIAGWDGHRYAGLAPDATFLLARTERTASEWYSEELFWIAAAEWADRMGAAIINSSLGYTKHRYFPEDLDGQHSLLSRTAAEVARKGILVVNAAGNDGASSWRTLGVPADAQHVLTVGGTDPYTDAGISFSSRGPTRDGRLKPEVSAPAIVAVAGPKGWTSASGTSFACPLVAGFAACIRQHNPQLNRQQLYDTLIFSGHLYPYFDYTHGYGIPQFSRLYSGGKDSLIFDLVVEGDFLSVILRNAETHTKTSNLYYCIQNQEGGILAYSTLRVESRIPFTLNLNLLAPGQKLVVHCEGQTSSYVR
jgi:subtilisin family serine protease